MEYGGVGHATVAPRLKTELFSKLDVTVATKSV